MATHRWTHCAPSDVPFVVRWFQDAGIFLTRKGHSIHHTDYTENFSLLTGWGNPTLNFLVKHVAHHNNMAWFWVFVAWALALPPLPA